MSERADPGDRQVSALYLCYWSLLDPLCQSQSLPYLTRLAARGHRTILITFEQPAWRLAREQRRAMQRKLATAGILWRPLTYHKRPSLVATAWDCLAGVVVGSFLVARHCPRVVHSRASVPGAMALALSTLWRRRFLYDADSRLSLEYADNGHWRRDSLAFRLTAGVEARCRRRADEIVVLAAPLGDDFRREGIKVPITVIPCCVDTSRIRFDGDARGARRRELGLDDEPLFVYVGKTGPRYLIDEMFDFVRITREELGSGSLFIASGEPAETFHAIGERHGVNRDVVTVRPVDQADIPGWLSAADAGLAFIRSTECERGSSPIKIAEYLAAGLPVVITSGIGDLSATVGQHRLGAVLGRADADGYRAAVRTLRQLWAEREATRDRCRAACHERLDVDAVGEARYLAVYDRLAGTPPRPATFDGTRTGDTLERVQA